MGPDDKELTPEQKTLIRETLTKPAPIKKCDTVTIRGQEWKVVSIGHGMMKLKRVG